MRLNLGGGTFGAARSFAMEGGISQDIAARDLNNDGNVDIVTTGATDGNLGYSTVRLGLGDGSFGAAVSYASAETIGSVAVALGDLNGDGVLDLVSAGRSLAFTGVGTIRLGNGDGTFAAARSFATEPGRSNGLALGDVNGDGVHDIVTAGYGGSGFATVFTGTTTSGVSPLLDFSLATSAGARQALPVFKQKLDQLARQRGSIGAFESKISAALGTARVTVENLAAARSQIVDADIAEESANLVKRRILQQAGAAILSQANGAPELALRLLQ